MPKHDSDYDIDHDFSVAMLRGPRHFDGNAQSRVREWIWAFVDRLEDEDYAVLAEATSLDWVVIPLPGII